MEIKAVKFRKDGFYDESENARVFKRGMNRSF